MQPLLGLFLHAVGGFAAGSFYIPVKRVRAWAWESGWLVVGVAAWVGVPAVAAALTVPDFAAVIGAAEGSTLGYTYMFGVRWGIGGLTFGLALRYLGVSLGMAVALGLTAAAGTLVPPIYAGTFGALLATSAGVQTLAGVAVCLAGIAVCGYAGVLKERALAAAAPAAETGGGAGAEAGAAADDDEFELGRGVGVAAVSGLLRACFAFGLAAGGDIAEGAVASGADPLYQNNATLVVLLLGGLTTNGLYSVVLNLTRGTYRDYADAAAPLGRNYAWAALGGATWYLQFFFYGMGATLLGERFEFASWTLHMAFIILFSTAWGLHEGEWRRAGGASRRALWWGLGIIVASTVVIGLAGAGGE